LSGKAFVLIKCQVGHYNVTRNAQQTDQKENRIVYNCLVYDAPNEDNQYGCSKCEGYH